MCSSDLKRKRNEEFKKLEKKLKDEQEAYRKKLEEEWTLDFLASLKKDRQKNITPVEEIKFTPPCNEQVELPHNSGQESEASQIDRVHEESRNDSETVVASVEKAESNITCAESIESKEASFIDEEHGEPSETAVLNFS